MVAVEPSRLALTTTPSMAPSAAELTWPASAAGACAWAGTAASTAAIAPAVRASRKLRDGIGRLLDIRSPLRRRVACHELASCASLNPRIHGFKTDRSDHAKCARPAAAPAPGRRRPE